MIDNKNQLRSSALAVVLCGVFLLTGKLFVWKTPAADIVEPNPPASSDTTTTSAGTSTSSQTSTTTTTAITSADMPADSTQSAIATDSTVASNALTDQTSSTSLTTTTTTTTTAAQISVSADSDLDAAPAGYFQDALFIGDSRTVGMANYAPLEGADYFATIGLQTYQVNEAKNEVGEEDKKSLSFTQLISSRTYGKIYIMLGINELGNDRTKTLLHYQELLDQVRKAQPDAIIYIEANLHVAQSRSETDPVINNVQIDSLNAALAKLADDKTVYYLDVNPLFDDENHALGAEYTHDGTHPLAKYYRTWVEWLKEHVVAS